MCRIENSVSDSKKLELALATYSEDFKKSMDHTVPASFNRIVYQLVSDDIERRIWIDRYTRAISDSERKTTVADFFVRARDNVKNDPELEAKSIDKTLRTYASRSCQLIHPESVTVPFARIGSSNDLTQISPAGAEDAIQKLNFAYPRPAEEVRTPSSVD